MDRGVVSVDFQGHRRNPAGLHARSDVCATPEEPMRSRRCRRRRSDLLYLRSRVELPVKPNRWGGTHTLSDSSIDTCFGKATRYSLEVPPRARRTVLFSSVKSTHAHRTAPPQVRLLHSRSASHVTAHTHPHRRSLPVPTCHDRSGPRSTTTSSGRLRPRSRRYVSFADGVRQDTASHLQP